jgi:6-phosphogluconolactonase (cycloisomerase 2 family)
MAEARESDNLRSGAVYTMTDELTNRVVAYYRDADGSLTDAGSFPTGGMGSGFGNIFGQGAVVLSGNDLGARVTRGHQLLFVTNAGSNDISVFRVEKDALVLVEREPSRGIRPIAVAVYQDALYVLNQNSGTIVGFHLGARGELTPIAGSERLIAGGATSNPAQVEFSKHGDFLVVTERATANINVFLFDKHTDLASATPVVNRSVGLEPFGFAFDNRDHLFVTDGFFVAPAAGAASSYEVSDAGTLTPISPVVNNGGDDTCWLVITENSRFAYVHSFGDSRISSYTIDADGTLTLLESAAAFTNTGPGAFDISLTYGSKYLYALNSGNGTVSGFAVESNGALTPAGRVGGLPPSTVGLAAR